MMKTVSTANFALWDLKRCILDARALFERVISSFSAGAARPIWETWTSYEFNYGDLSAAAKLEKRMAEVYPDGQFFTC